MATVWSGSTFKLDSNGNGSTYTLTNVTAGADLFFQGDDALLFEKELNAMEAAHPERHLDAIMVELWNIYS